MTSRSATTTKRKSARRRAHPPIHPGEILEEEFLAPLAVSQYRLAKDISVPARRINEIVHGVARNLGSHGASTRARLLRTRRSSG